MAENVSPDQVEKPVVYILHGDDRLAIQEHLEKMKAGLGDEGVFETNLVRFDCRTASEEDIRSAAMSLPFLAPRRIIVLTNPLAKLEGGKENEAMVKARLRFLAMLDQLPHTTALVLVIEDHYQGYRGWAALNDNHWLKQWIAAVGARAFYQPCALPRADEMPAWIMKRAREGNGRFTEGAAGALAGMVENDTLLAQQEIVKLLTYVDRQRPVEAEDVERLCSGASGNVFEMVDAIGKKDRHKALRQLHILLEKNEAQGLFFMTVRQFRLLLQVREAMDDGGSLESGTSEFKRSLPLDRLRSQAQRFSMPQLERIYHQLFEMDKAIKSGKLTPELALDMLIAQID